MNARRSATVLLALLTAGIGLAMLVVTALHGGGVGYLLGVLFVAAGFGRLYLARERSR